MDNEELLLEKWHNFWLPIKNNKKYLSALNNENNKIHFLSSFNSDIDGTVITNNIVGYGNLNRFTLTLFLESLNQKLNLSYKKIMVLHNINDSKFIYETFINFLSECKSNLYSTTQRVRTPKNLIKQFAVRVSVDYIFYFDSNDEGQFTIDVFDSRGNRIDKSIVDEVVTDYIEKSVMSSTKNTLKIIEIEQSLIIENYIEKIREEFSGASIYDDKMIKIGIYNSLSNNNKIFKELSAKSEFDITFIKNYNKGFFTEIFNYFLLKKIKKFDILLKFDRNSKNFDIEVRDGKKYKKLTKNELIGSYLEFFLEQEKINYGYNEFNILLDFESNKFVESIISKYNIHQNKNDKYFFNDLNDFYSISSAYEFDNIPFIFKYIQYINYLKTQGTNVHFKWISLNKIYGDHKEFITTFDWIKLDRTLLLNSIWKVFGESKIEILNIEYLNKIKKNVEYLFKINLNNTDFIVITFDNQHKRYTFKLNKYNIKDKKARKNKKYAKHILNISKKALIETS